MKHEQGPSRKRWKTLVSGVVVCLIAAVVIAAWRLVEEAKPPAPSPEAMRARQMVVGMPDGIERFMITDINNPAATGRPSKESMLQWDFEDPKVQRQIAEYAAEAQGARQHRGAPTRSAAPPAPPIPYYEDPQKVYWPGHNTEEYDHLPESRFIEAALTPLSTFSIDVDTASYANVRRFLTQDALPPQGAVRIEELVNYFDYDYAPPEDDVPFATHLNVAECPWQPGNWLSRVALKGREIEAAARPNVNLVFLIDVSGSMQPENKLPLVKKSLALLVKQLHGGDRIALVVYAGSSGLALSSTRGSDKRTILAALDQLQSGGSTNGGEGIELAYRIASDNFVEGGVNRVILATDGDFNVGVTNQSELTRLIEEKRESGVFLTTLGFGMGNLNDSTLESLANKGNGAYAYIDTLHEARKVFVEELTGSLVTIAKDVKIQVEFNPARVHSYRLIGYENRELAPEDFKDDTVDAGEIGAGHTVTALYELVPAGSSRAAGVDPLRYQASSLTRTATSGELFTVSLRYKAPDGHTSTPLKFPFAEQAVAFADTPPDFRFAAAVAAWGMLLRGSEHSGTSTYYDVQAWAEGARGWGEDSYRREFIQLVQRAAALSGES